MNWLRKKGVLTRYTAGGWYAPSQAVVAWCHVVQAAALIVLVVKL